MSPLGKQRQWFNAAETWILACESLIKHAIRTEGNREMLTKCLHKHIRGEFEE